jgi:L-arabinose 1-dehydrogenase [NAD(P)+]
MEIMPEIAVTGAAGNVGREVLDGFDDTEHESVAFTHSEHDDIDSETLDVTNRTEVLEKLDGFNVVIHLAGASAPDAEWETTVETNIQGTKHVFDAAVENSIDRVVFASSNHAVGMYNVAVRPTPRT